MRLLMHPGALARIGTELAAFPDVEPALIDDTGAVTVGGASVERAAFKPQAAWLSIDFFRAKQAPAFFDIVLNAGSVQWMQTFNAGLDLPVFKEVVAKGVRLTNSDAQAIPIAEYVVANVLAELHPIAAHRKAQREKTWRMVPFREISQTTWLIVGYGKIGLEIAKRARAFGARIVGVRRNPQKHELADEMGTQADLPRLLPEADVVVLASALNEQTRDIASASFFAAMKPGAVLVNIGRGALVDDAALLAALDAGTPSVAILDVFREEPLPPTSPYWEHPNVRVSAHTSAAGAGTIPRGDRLFLGNLRRFLNGEALVNEVDKRSL